MKTPYNVYRNMALKAVYRAGTEKGPSFSVNDRVDKVALWLVTNPRLYFPLDQNLPPSTRRHGVTSKVYLWTTDEASLNKNDVRIKPISDGVCQVKLKDSGCLEHAVKDMQARLRKTKWKKISVPQCSGGLSLMDVSTVIQAVIVYMKDHYPTTPEEFNFHAELKAACHWHWLDDTKPHPFMKPVPYDDCRLKIAATETLKTWEEELKALEAECKGMEVEHCDSSDESLEEQLLDLRQAIYVLEKHFGSDMTSMSDETELPKKRGLTKGQSGSPKKVRKLDEESPERRSLRLLVRGGLLGLFPVPVGVYASMSRQTESPKKRGFTKEQSHSPEQARRSPRRLRTTVFTKA